MTASTAELEHGKPMQGESVYLFRAELHCLHSLWQSQRTVMWTVQGVHPSPTQELQHLAGPATSDDGVHVVVMKVRWTSEADATVPAQAQPHAHWTLQPHSCNGTWMALSKASQHKL